MLVKGREVNHPSGATFNTPLLVPSFSSKGFRQDEILTDFKIAGSILTEAVLVSAFDIYKNHLPKLDVPFTEITFVDSGGYETSPDYDLSTINRPSISAIEWLPENVMEIYDRWSENVPAVFVNFDSEMKQAIESQINSAENFHSRYPNQLKTILLKSESKNELINPTNVINNITRLNNFDIIGFTEKELGDSLLQRMHSIARIRISMNENNIDKPLHIFGSLDPISTPLYFLAGAEIFDGLTWLRYGYSKGIASYTHNIVALEMGIDKHKNGSQAQFLNNNYEYLFNLQNDMRKFLIKKDFEVFRDNDVFLRKSYNLFRNTFDWR